MPSRVRRDVAVVVLLAALGVAGVGGLALTLVSVQRTEADLRRALEAAEARNRRLHAESLADRAAIRAELAAGRRERADLDRRLQAGRDGP